MLHYLQVFKSWGNITGYQTYVSDVINLNCFDILLHKTLNMMNLFKNSVKPDLN